MCGAVSYSADVHDAISACHCEMCRRWAGGPLISIGTNSVTFSGEGNITTYTSSKWAERGFCNKCGSGLFYRITADGKYRGFTSVNFGTLDDQSGLEMNREWFSDRRPDAYAFAGERKQVTEAEAFAMLDSADDHG